MLHPEVFLIFVTIRLVVSFPNSADGISVEQEWYSPAFEGEPLVPKTNLRENFEWIDPKIQNELQDISDSTAEKFAFRIGKICREVPTLDQIKKIVMGILNPSDSPTYLNILSEECSAAITGSVPYLLADPYYRILAGFQNWKGNHAYVEAILSKGKDKLRNLSKISNLPVEKPNIYGISPMLAACRIGSYYEAKRILKSEQVLYGRRDPLGRTALHLVAQYYSSVKFIRLLLENGGFDVNSQDVEGNSPLHLAYYHLLYGDHQSVLTQDEATSTTGSFNSNPAESVLEYIILHSPELNVNIQNQDGDTVLHLASGELDAFLVEQLLSSRVEIDVTIKDGHGRTALDIIYELGYTATLPQDVSRFAACLAAFIKSKIEFIDPMQRLDPVGNTVIHLMCQTLQYSALARLLQLPDIDVNVENEVNRIPFQVAFEADNNFIGPLTKFFLGDIRTDVAVALNSDQDTILHIACRSRDLPTVNALLKYPRAPINVYNLRGRVPLHVAYEFDDPLVSGPMPTWGNHRSVTDMFIIEELLQHPKTDPNMPNHERDALIHMACRLQDYSTMKKLLKLKRTNVNLRGRDGKTPMEIAFDYEDLRLIDSQILQKHSQEELDNPAQSILGLLFQHERAVPDIRIGGNRNTLLHHACDWMNTAAIRLLLDNPNTNVNELNSLSRTALWIAYQRDCESNRGGSRIGRVTMELIDCPRVDASAPINDAGDTLLHVACRRGDITGITHLLSLENLNVNAVNRAGHTPFQIAYHFDQNTEGALSRPNELYIGPLTRKLLADPRVDFNVPIDEHHNTILHMLTRFKHQDLSKQEYMNDLVRQVLSSHGVNPNIENDERLTPLHYAYRNEGLTASGYKGALGLLLQDQRTNPNIPIGKHGGSLLHLACLLSELQAVELLLKHPNIDIMVQDGQEVIPFELALEMKHKNNNLQSQSIIKMIFDVGAQRLTDEGKNVLQNALKKDMEAKTAEILKKKRSLWYRLNH